MYAIGDALLRDLGSATFQKREKASKIGQNHIGPLEASGGFCFRPRRDTGQHQHGQASEGPGGSNIGVQAIPHRGDVSGTNAPGIGHKFQPGRLWLANDDGLYPGGGAQCRDNCPCARGCGGQRIGIGDVQIRGNKGRSTANGIVRMSVICHRSDPCPSRPRRASHPRVSGRR